MINFGGYRNLFGVFLLKLRENNDNEIKRTESAAGTAGIFTIIFTSVSNIDLCIQCYSCYTEIQEKHMN